MDFTYLSQPPRKFTFEQPKLKLWTEKNCKGLCLNLFAGKTKLNINEVRVDSNKDMVADYYMEAEKYVNMAIENEWRYDTIILDPPYNLRKSREKYDGKYIGSFTKIKNLLPKILNNYGFVLTYGYDSVGMAKCRGFKKLAICLVCHNGDHNDTICLKEELI